MNTTLEEFRKEVFSILYGAVMAEREACAKIAANEVGGPNGKIIADRIRARPDIKLPPMSLGLKDVVIASLAPHTGGKK